MYKDDPFHFADGLDFAVQIIRGDETKWSTIMEWISLETALNNCRKLAQEGFMSKIRCVKKSRYPPWPVCSVHYYRENKQ
jgi:hypothetical protein